MKFCLLFAIFVIGALTPTSAKGHHGGSHHSHGVVTPNPNGGSGVKEGDLRKVLHRDVTNRMFSDNERGRDHAPTSQNGTYITSQVPNASAAAPLKRVKNASPTEEKKNLLHRYAQEHNVNKKQLEDQVGILPFHDEDGIPMETEFLIHVTPNPPNARKMKKSQSQKRRSTTSKPKASQNPVKDNSKSEKGRKTTSETSLKSRRNKQRQQNFNMAPSKKGSIAGTKRAGKGNGKNGKNRRYPKKYNPQKHSWKKNQKKEKMNERNRGKHEKMSEKMKEKREKRNKKIKASHKPTAKKI